MSFGKNAIYAGVGLLALSAGSNPALAQATSTPEAEVGDATGELAPDNEIIVQARRRDESVQDVPQTVNVVTAAQVEKLNLRTFQEITSVVPGLTLTQTSSFSSSATVRGVAFVPEASGNNPSVEFYLNDAPISSGFLFQSTFDFGQFELQRGPQGTLRGRAAPSGAIAVTVRRPDLDEVGAVFNGTITDLHARKVDGAFNIPIISNVLAVRIAGVIDNNRGNRVHSLKEISDPANNPGPYRRTKSIRGQIRFEPIDWLRVNLMAQQLHSVDHSYGQVISDSMVNPAAATPNTPIIGAFDRLSTQDQGQYGRQDHQVYIANAALDFAGQTLSYVGSYNEQRFGSLAAGDSDLGDFFAPPRVATVRRTQTDPAGFATACAIESRETRFAATTGAFAQCTSGVAKRESHELRLASQARIAGIFDYVVGGFYDHNNNPTDLTQQTPIVIQTSATGFTLATVSLTPIGRRGHTTEKSAFGNVTAHLLDDKLELSGGLRFIDYKSDSKLIVGGVALTDQRDKDNATVYTASAKYNFTPNVMVYALTGSSFRPGPRVVGDFNLRLSARENRFTNLPPEKSKSYEIGAKTSFLDGRGRLNIAAYHQTFKNYPFRGPGINFVNYVSVGGVVTPSVGSFNFVAPVPVEVNGLEGEASFEILDRWSIGLNASYSDGKIKNGTIACNDINGDGVPDINVPTPTTAALLASLPAGENVAQCSGVNRRSLSTPKFGANVQSEFGFDVGASADGFVRGLYNLFGKTANDPDNTFDDVGSYGLLNLYAGIRAEDGSWEISLFGKNITKEREILNVGSGPLATGYRRLTPPTFRSVVSETFTSQYRSVQITAPREFGITAKIALGGR